MFYDVIIIGTGGAGCAAAIEAAKRVNNVALITAKDFFQSKTALSQGCIQAPIGPKDSVKAHYQDTIAAGESTNNKQLVSVLSEMSISTINWLEKYGVCFKRKNDNSYFLQDAGGTKYPRILSCSKGNGRHIINCLYYEIKQSNINIFEYHSVLDISKKENMFYTKLLNIETKKKISFISRSIVIATGGLMPKKKQAGLIDCKNFDVLYFAKNLNLKMKNIELMQYHPTGIILPKALRRKNAPEILRSAGATLLNNRNKQFVDSLLTRKLLCDAIINECEKDNCVETDDGRKGVWLNTIEIDKINGEGYCARNFPEFYNLMLENNHDITKKPILVFPNLHYSLGGIVINKNTETSCNGVFSAGEATYGVHGNDRLMGNALLDAFVFGQISGKNAAEYAKNYAVK